MEIFLIRQLDNTFSIPYSSDHDKIRHIKVGQLTKCEVTKPRNLGHHKKFFTLIEFVFQNQEQYRNKEHLRKDLTIEAGYYDTYKNFFSEEVKTPQSISFSSMDQIAFDKFYSDFIDAINRVYGFDKHDMLENIDQHYS